MATERGKIQWEHFKANLIKMGLDFQLRPKILELGSGKGELCLSAIEAGFDCFGLEVDSNIYDSSRLLFLENNNQYHEKYLFLYDGDHIPFPASFFDASISFYVIEHIKDIGVVLREITRCLKSGGLVYFRWQDPKIFYEGHANIPWLPFMPKYIINLWCNEFNIDEQKRNYILNYCYNNTIENVSGILSFLGWEILEFSPVPECLIPFHYEYETESEIRSLVKNIRKKIENGEWPNSPNQQFPYLKARKM
ncbi:class I SAM-dependent methyltransferase [Planktothrix agardhii 1032]|uniref:class I SAM-dependent methyltransferase n=1 Tax=Planktothrix agardhii TaxID=1160 RepID=UPI001D09CE62|nr:class I SAM-dependent methyltransferase [Planktothrix agardhii]MCB8776055.1 class I SAM-dependent methyltransferase [Planktothrix agardhii 1031]MCF3600438.1 class I SAM-dependent methyltransferase [Planktothrix agardhii 1032]